MDWYQYYRLVKDGDGYTLELYLNKNSTEFSSEFFANIKENVLQLDGKIKKLIDEKFKDIKINSIKLFLGALIVASIPFTSIQNMKAASVDSAQTTAQFEAQTQAQAQHSIYDFNAIGTVTAYSLNVRSGPSTDSYIINVLWNGNKVNITGETDSWYRVLMADGRIGWVSKTYIKLDQQSNYTVNPLNASGIVTASALNVRSGPSTSYSVISSLWNGSSIKITGETGSWYKVQLTDGRTGWVSKTYVKLDQQGNYTVNPLNASGIVTASALNVRSGPSTSYSVISSLWNGSSIKITGETGSWYRIQLTDGRTGWVSKSYVQISTVQQKINTVIATANSLLGTPYVWGGESPAEGGFDCSGLTYYVYGKVGYKLNRISADQAKQGIGVSRWNIKPGDLVFYSNKMNGVIDHVGIYIGDGKMIHSPKAGEVVKAVSITTSYWENRFITARRIIY